MVEETNDQDIEHNEGKVKIDYRKKVEADANHQNLINGIKILIKMKSG